MRGLRRVGYELQLDCVYSSVSARLGRPSGGDDSGASASFCTGEDAEMRHSIGSLSLHGVDMFETKYSGYVRVSLP